MKRVRRRILHEAVDVGKLIAEFTSFIGTDASVFKPEKGSW